MQSTRAISKPANRSLTRLQPKLHPFSPPND
jgi:hypothetical protein